MYWPFFGRPPDSPLVSESPVLNSLGKTPIIALLITKLWKGKGHLEQPEPSDWSAQNTSRGRRYIFWAEKQAQRRRIRIY